MSFYGKLSNFGVMLSEFSNKASPGNFNPTVSILKKSEFHYSYYRTF